MAISFGKSVTKILTCSNFFFPHRHGRWIQKQRKSFDRHLSTNSWIKQKNDRLPNKHSGSGNAPPRLHASIGCAPYLRRQELNSVLPPCSHFVHTHNVLTPRWRHLRHLACCHGNPRTLRYYGDDWRPASTSIPSHHSRYSLITRANKNSCVACIKGSGYTEQQQPRVFRFLIYMLTKYIFYTQYLFW